MKYKVLTLTILLMLFVSSSPIANASEPETILPLEDTYTNTFSFNSTYGERDHLEVSDYATGLCIAFLMFDISNVLDVRYEVKLRLYCFLVVDPNIIGVRWCVNNTWNEENLNALRAGGFSRTGLEDYVTVDSPDTWYEWKVTNFVSKAMEENYEKITLTLEVENRLEGVARSLFASKDQDWPVYRPQLVFTHLEPRANSLNSIIIVASGFITTVAIAFLAYRFSKKSTRKTRHHKKARETE